MRNLLSTALAANLFGTGPILASANRFHTEPHTYSSRLARSGATSLAGRPHDDQREIARRARQLARNAAKQQARLEVELAIYGESYRNWLVANAVGFSRRGREVLAA